MYTTIFTSINLRYFSFLLLLFLYTSCQSGEEQSTTESISAERVKHSTKDSFEVLTEESAVEFLSNYTKSGGDSLVVISTSYGNITIRLYQNTLLHNANFRYLISRNYFNDTWFYRVSKGHVIQAGNTDGRETIRKREKIGEYRIPPEIVATNYHKYGAVAAARSYKQNPEKKSDPYEFYIVLGKEYTRRELQLLAKKHNFEMNNEALNFYQNRRGSPHLDGQHTVFGEVIKGMDVVEKISQVQVDEGEWPLVNIPISISLKAK